MALTRYPKAQDELVLDSTTDVKPTLNAHPAVQQTSVLAASDEGSRLSVTTAPPLPETVVGGYGIRITHTTVNAHAATLHLRVLPAIDIDAVLADLETAFGQVRTHAITQAGELVNTLASDPLELPTDLTDKQFMAPQAAYRHGYFKQPREHTATDIAAALGLSHSTFLQHLHRAEQKVFATLLD
ncbi:MAG: helix-turn-helix domain-containing protein [Salinarchaeum sp.]